MTVERQPKADLPKTETPTRILRLFANNWRVPSIMEWVCLLT